jgi:hypothetical protein
LELKNKTTTELKVLQDKLSFELAQRKGEVEIPVLQMIGNSNDKELFDLDSIVQQKDYINNSILKAINDKNRIFNIKLVMIPESDYADLKNNSEI